MINLDTQYSMPEKPFAYHHQSLEDIANNRLIIKAADEKLETVEHPMAHPLWWQACINTFDLELKLNYDNIIRYDQNLVQDIQALIKVVSIPNYRNPSDVRNINQLPLAREIARRLIAARNKVAAASKAK